MRSYNQHHPPDFGCHCGGKYDSTTSGNTCVSVITECVSSWVWDNFSLDLIQVLHAGVKFPYKLNTESASMLWLRKITTVNSLFTGSILNECCFCVRSICHYGVHFFHVDFLTILVKIQHFLTHVLSCHGVHDCILSTVSESIDTRFGQHTWSCETAVHIWQHDLYRERPVPCIGQAAESMWITPPNMEYGFVRTVDGFSVKHWTDAVCGNIRWVTLTVRGESMTRPIYLERAMGEMQWCHCVVGILWWPPVI